MFFQNQYTFIKIGYSLKKSVGSITFFYEEFELLKFVQNDENPNSPREHTFYDSSKNNGCLSITI